MVALRVCLITLCLFSHALAFNPTSSKRWTSSPGQRRKTIIKDGFTISSRSKRDRYKRDFARDFARDFSMQMATELKFSDDENGMTNSTTESTSQAQTLFPKADILTIELPDHIPLGCTIEESLHEDDDYIFISKLTARGNAEKSGLVVGDVVLGLTGMFGELTSTIGFDTEKIKQLVSAVPEKELLTIMVARGTIILERHEKTIVELCNLSETDDQNVQECVVNFIAGGYDYDVDAANESDAVKDEELCNDADTECLIDDMMNLWAEELPLPPTTSGITDQANKPTPKTVKPWSSRSSPSGTWVRDPKTGKMRNIDQ
eukprot:CAMPEP_0201126844 /NCGR_PEP_ID=MMETSP0850-20130426/27720_1 /ASSEMBLY_ACC=CAM_ASM_000622 /TAXON_ID=183588 /ORGANISM="Pseudo-nitzschia fraudulenta, Strain WWA7" /LENGTH=317 /DNA_ID=CAMNT_0047395453 /DNA_START=131 /DNA_END=1084 /DNA_ORIENTATION=+